MSWKTARRTSFAVLGLVLLTALPLLALEAPPLTNWTAPSSYTPARGSSGLRTETDISNPVPFIPTTPCRQYDSRNFTPLPQATNRSVTLTGAPCGIPASAVAVSVNITVFNITGATTNATFKVDTVSPPAVSWINYPPSETQRANAGAVALGAGGVIWVQVAQGAGQVDFLVDTNGYYYNGNISNELVAGEFFAIIGRYGSGGVLYPWNRDPAGANDYGLNAFADSTGAGSAGVHGRSNAATGATAGVLGDNNSTGASAVGVRGIDASGVPTGTFGITAGGLFDSTTGGGVYGRSRYVGAGGQLYNTAGGFIAEGLLGTTFGTSSDGTPNPWAVFANGNFGASGAKHFVEPHATDASKVITYSSLEGREVGTYFRGTARVSGGRAIIQIPDDFRMVTDEEGLTVQLTSVRAFAQMYVESQDLNQIVIHSNKDVTFHYLVQGVRRAFKNFEPVAIGYEFVPRSADARMPAYLTEEAQRRLIENGTYNSDGTVNMRTAEAMGWTKIWQQRESEVRASAAAESARRAKEGRSQGTQ